MSIVISGKVLVLPIIQKCQKRFITKAAMMYSNPAVAVQESFPHFRTSENNPLAHVKDHIGKLYTLPPEVVKKIFVTGGVPKPLDLQMETFRESSIIIRRPAIEIISYLKRINFCDPAVRFVIYGNLGTGKSTTITHIVHYGYESKFLLLHLPWVSNWTKTPKEVVASQYNPDRIDIPVESALWLQHFKSQNAELITELDLRTTKTYTWSKREVAEEGSPISDIIEHGLQRVIHASDCVAVLLKEIKLHSASGKFKAMVVVDGANAFWCKTNVKKPDKTLVPAQNITVARAFIKLLQNDWNNAVIITTVDKIPFKRTSTMQDPYTPHAILGKEGFELLSPFVPIHVENYTDKELNTIIDYYCDRLWIQSERARSEEGRKQLRFLSGNNPLELMKLCDPL